MENSTYGKFHLRKIPPTENSTYGQIDHISKTKNLKKLKIGRGPYRQNCPQVALSWWNCPGGIYRSRNICIRKSRSLLALFTQQNALHSRVVYPGRQHETPSEQHQRSVYCYYFGIFINVISSFLSMFFRHFYQCYFVFFYHSIDLSFISK